MEDKLIEEILAKAHEHLNKGMENTSAGSPKFIGNDAGLLAIETTYDPKRLKTAQEEGLNCLIIPVVKNPSLELRSLLLKNRWTKEIVSVPSREYYVQSQIYKYSIFKWKLVREETGYGRTRDHTQNWGAYIIPKDLEVGEKVYISDLIQDIVATSFWYTVWPAGDAIATWDGEKLIIDQDEYDKFHLIG
jgi:hypothetical protein